MSAVETATAQRPRLVLRSAEFRRGREESWRELDDLVTRVEKRGISAVSAADLQRMPLLYRTVLSSLSVARSIALDRNLLRYLESLSLRAYITVYGPRSGILANLGRFFTRGFPAAVRQVGWHALVAFLALLVGAIAGYMLVSADEAWFVGFVPDDLAGGRGPSSTAAELRDGELFAPWPGFVDSFIVFANALFRNNAMVGILAFGLGIFAGVPTLLLMVYQGLILGAFLALHANRGLFVDCLGWLSIHGVTEIGAIVLCAAGGLWIAQTMLFPGRHTRLESLALHGKGAAGVAAGAVMMLFLAGLIEGGCRQLIDNTTVRFAFAAVTAVLWLAYFTLGRRRSGDGPAS